MFASDGSDPCCRLHRPAQNLPFGVPHLFLTYSWNALIILRELNAVPPAATCSVQVHLDVDYYVRVTPSMQRTNLRNPVPESHRRLKSASLGISNIAQKPERVENIRFPRSVRPDEKYWRRKMTSTERKLRLFSSRSLVKRTVTLQPRCGAVGTTGDPTPSFPTHTVLFGTPCGLPRSSRRGA